MATEQNIGLKGALAAIETYCEATRQADIGKLREVFEPSTVLKTFHPDGSLRSMSLDAYCEFVAKRGSSQHNTMVESLRLDSDATAFAEVLFVFPDYQVRDYLTLFYSQGSWRIVNKSFRRFAE
jgi:hypothetical protein